MEFTRNSNKDLTDKVYKPLLEQAQAERKQLGLETPENYRVDIKEHINPQIRFNVVAAISDSPMLIISHAGKPSETDRLNHIRASIDAVSVANSALYQEHAQAKAAFLNRSSGTRPSHDVAERYLNAVVNNLPLLSARRELFFQIPYGNWHIQGTPEEDNAPLVLVEDIAQKVLQRDQLTLQDSIIPPLNVLGKYLNRDNPLLDVLEASRTGSYPHQKLRMGTKNENEEMIESKIYQAAIDVAILAQADMRLLEEAFAVCKTQEEITDFSHKVSTNGFH